MQGADYFGALIISNIFKGNYKPYRCDAGKSRITVNDKGDIFACSVMCGNNRFKFGNIYNGINTKEQKKFQYIYVNDTSVCSSCLIQNRCGGECYVNSYLNYNDVFTPLPKMCLIKIELNKLSMAFINLIKNHYSDMYNKLVDFVFEVRSYQTTDINIWVIMLYLKIRGISVDYNDIFNLISTQNLDEGLINILNPINQYFKDVSAYQLDNPKDLLDIRYPAIAIINRETLSENQYAIVLGCDNSIIKYKLFSSKINDSEKISIEEFYYNISNLLIF